MRRFAVVLLFVWTFLTPMVHADSAEAAEDAKKFELPPGFKIEVAAAEPLLYNPVAFSIDEKGRIFVAETHRLDNAVLDVTKHTNWIKSDLSFRVVSERGRFLTNVFGTNSWIFNARSERLNMLSDTNGDGIYDTNLTVRAAYKTPVSGLAAGVLARGNKVWFACVPDLWRYEGPENAPNLAVRLLSSGYGVHIGVTGHDLHGLTIGMDGKIYYSMGDRGFVIRTTSGTYNYPDTGGVLRCNQDGSDLEVFASGLRNPQELTFDELGNLWTADNDTAGEDKCRLIHVVEGADYGWRCSYQHMEGYGPWVKENLWEGRLDGTLPTCGDPAQGPAGFAYYPGTGLGDDFNGRFLLCDFPGGIQSFTVEPKGASYVIKDKKRFLWNAWPTDVEFGPDGALYFSDWVGGWTLPNKGRIYRLVNPEIAKDPKTIETAKILHEGFESRDAANLLALLDHHDLRVRQGSHLALAKKRSDSAAPLRALVTDTSKSRRSRIHAIWTLRLQGAIEPAIYEKLLADQDPEIRAQIVAGAPTASVIKALNDENPRVRFYAANALRSKLLLDSNNSLVVQAILDLLEKNNDTDPYLTHAGTRLLAFSSPALQKAKRHSSVALRRAAMLAERSLGSSSIANYLKEPELAYEAARAINDVPIAVAYPQLAYLLTNNCPEKILSRAINANFRIGGPDSAKRLANFAAATNAPLAARIDALGCLSDWEQPNELDRVVGLWRPISANLSTRPATLAAKALEPYWPQLLHENDDRIAIATLHTLRDLEVIGQSSNVVALFQARDRRDTVRAAALEALRDIDQTNFLSSIDVALADKSLRMGALTLIQTNASPAAVKQILETISNETDLRTLQTAFATIGRVAPAEAVEPLRTALKKLGRKEAKPELSLDILQSAYQFTELKKEADTAATSAFSDPVSEPLLVGGDIAEGRKVFERTDTACARCHAIAGVGGTVGPALDGIGSKQNRLYLFESIKFPNKVIAPGFENVALTLNSGRMVSGAVTNETTLTVEVNSFEEGKIILKKSEIKSGVRSQSAMPEGLADLLSPLDFRNLIEFLASLK